MLLAVDTDTGAIITFLLVRGKTRDGQLIALLARHLRRLLARPLFQGKEKLWQSLGRAHLDGRYDRLEDAGHAEDYAFIGRVKEAAAQ